MTRRNRQRLLRAPNAHSVASPVSCARRMANLDYVLLSGRMANALSPDEIRDAGQTRAIAIRRTRDQTGALGSMPLRSPPEGEIRGLTKLVKRFAKSAS